MNFESVDARLDKRSVEYVIPERITRLTMAMHLMECGHGHHFAVTDDGKGLVLSPAAIDCLKLIGLNLPGAPGGVT